MKSKACAATTANGAACPYSAKSGKELCGIHERSQKGKIEKELLRKVSYAKNAAKIVGAAIAVTEALNSALARWPEILDWLSGFKDIAFIVGDVWAEHEAEMLEANVAEIVNSQTELELLKACSSFYAATRYIRSSAHLFLNSTTQINQATEEMGFNSRVRSTHDNIETAPKLRQSELLALLQQIVIADRKLDESMEQLRIYLR